MKRPTLEEIQAHWNLMGRDDGITFFGYEELVDEINRLQKENEQLRAALIDTKVISAGARTPVDLLRET